jgi:DNA polymerase
MQNNKNIFEFYQSSGLYDRVIFKNKNKKNSLTLEKLKERILSLKNIYSKQSHQLVFSDGNSKSKIMLIGDSPGISDEIDGKPFSKDAGLLLDKMLEAISLSRNKVYITNVVNFRLPDNRKLSENDIVNFQPLILDHIKIINPKLIMILGSTALKTLFNEQQSITKIRGKWLKLIINNYTYSCMSSYHPNFLIRQPSQKKFAWSDLQEFRDRIHKEKLC